MSSGERNPASEDLEPRSRASRYAIRLAYGAALLSVTWGAIAFSTSSTAESGTLQKPSATAPGTTKVFTVSGAEGSEGFQVQRAAGETLFISGEGTVPADVFLNDYDSLFGNPAHFLQYETVDDDQPLGLGFRLKTGQGSAGAGSLQRYDPPHPGLRYPLRRGARWSWSGSIGDRKERSTAMVLRMEDVRAAGRTHRDCAVVRWVTTPEPPEEPPPPSEEWHCPEIGLARVRGEVDLDLVEYHSPGVDLIGAGASRPATAADPATGGAIGVDPGRSSFVPGARLRLDGLAWSDSRTSATQFPPVGDSERMLLAEEDGNISMMDIDTGEVAWRIRLRGPIVAEPVLAGSLALIADSQKALFALDAETGQTRWSAVFDDMVSASPLVRRGLVVVATADRSVRALRLRDGRKTWELDRGSVVESPPAAHRATVVLGEESGSIASVGLANGEAEWEASTEGALTGGPAVGEGLAVVADDTGSIYGFDADSGELRWRRPIGRFGIPVGDPAVGASTVAINWSNSTEESFVSGLDPRTGDIAWERPLPGAPGSSPMIVGRTVAILTRDGTIATFAVADGRPVGGVTLPRLIEGGSTRDSRVDLSYLGEALVATTRESSPSLEIAWAQTTSFAFPAPSRARDEEPSGVSFSSELRPVADPWRSPPALIGTDLVYPGSAGGVLAVGADGSERSLASGDPLPFVVDVDGLVVFPQGEDLVAVRPADGNEVWRSRVGASEPGAVPAVAGSGLAVPIPGSSLMMLDARTGEERWRRELTGFGRSSPLALENGDVVYGVGGLTRYDGETGEVDWSVPGVEAFAPLALADARVFVIGLVGEDAVMLAVDARSGTELWRIPFSPSLLMGPAVADGAVVAVDENGAAMGIDARTGDLLWTYEMRSAPCGTPIATAGAVVLFEGGRSEDLNERDFRLTAVEPRTGRFLGALEPNGSSTALGDCGATGDRIAVVAALVGQLTRVSSL